MTLLELVAATSGYLEKRGVPQPRLNAELLVAGALGVRRLDLYLQFERGVTDAERDRLRPLVKRRGEREPVQHLLGCADFHGRSFRSDARALVPRPETEVLVEAVLGELPEGRGPLAIADAGTGSGVVAVALLLARPEWRAVATDISGAALELARENAAAAGVAGRIEFHQGNLLDAFAGPFGLIAANLPYLPAAAIGGLEPEVRRDPRQALDGGPDGLQWLRPLIAQAPVRLEPGGLLALEMGADQGPAVRALLAAAGFDAIRILPDLAGRERVALARRP